MREASTGTDRRGVKKNAFFACERRSAYAEQAFGDRTIETRETLEETLRFAAWRLGRGDAVYLTVGLRIYPGTTLHRIALAEGVVEGGDPLLAPRFYFSDALRLEDAIQRLRRFAADHPRFMFSADSRSPFLPYLTRLAGLLHLPRPHWRYMGLFQRVARLGDRMRATA